MQRGGPRCKKPFLLSFVRPTCKKAGRHAGLAARDAKTILASRTANLACRPSYSTVLLFHYFTFSLQVQYCRGRCLGLAARDAKKLSTYYHALQQNVVFASRTANLACRPSYSTVLLFYYFTFSLHARDAKKRFCISDGQPCMSALLFYCFTNITIFLFCSRYSTAAANVWGWPPEMQKVFHVLPRTTAERSFCISDGQPCMSALLFYCFTLQIQYCRGRCLGLAARDAKSFPRTTTHHHVLPRTTAERSFASRTANLACRPSYSIFFTNLIFYYFTPDTVLPRPMFRVGRPRCEKIFHVLPRTTTYYHVLPRTTAERSFCISDGQPCMSALLFYCFTILLFHSRYSTAAADVWGWPPEMQKSFPRTTTYYHILPRTRTTTY